MEQEHKKQIEKIIGEMKYPKDFICYKSRFEDLCKAKDIGIELLLKCLEENPQKCLFSSPFEVGYLCQCPLRYYICNKLKK